MNCQFPQLQNEKFIFRIRCKFGSHNSQSVHEQKLIGRKKNYTP